MKKYIFLIVSFLLMSIAVTYSQDEPDCSDVTCPDGWNGPEQTGWVTIQLNDNVACVGKICYCSKFNDLEEEVNFWWKKIIWDDTTCYQEHYDSVDIDIFKKSIMRELIGDNQNNLPPVDCDDDGWYTANLFSTFCYMAYIYYRWDILIACEGEGYCVRSYEYCWDTSQTPWVLKVNDLGTVAYYEDDCYEPIIPWPFIHYCTPWCFYE